MERTLIPVFRREDA